MTCHAGFILQLTLFAFLLTVQKSLMSLRPLKSAGMAPGDALKIYDDLENAKCGLNLETDFHLIYLCTPLNISDNPHMETLADKLLHLNRLVL